MDPRNWALKVAIENRDYRTCVALLDVGADRGYLGTPLIEAILTRGGARPVNFDIVELLISRGADPFAGGFVCAFLCMIGTWDVRLVKLVQRLLPEKTAAFLANEKIQPTELLNVLYEQSSNASRATRRHAVEMILWLHSIGFRSDQFLEGRDIITNLQTDLVEREKLGRTMVFLVGAIQHGGETRMTMDVLRRVFGMMTFMPYL